MQPQYRQYAHAPHAQQMPQRSPHVVANNQRRGQMMPSGPPAQVPMAQAQMDRQQMAQAHAGDMAKRRSRKPTDKTMPDGVEDIIIGDGVSRYRDLRDYERRLDATMTRKRLDIVDSVNRNSRNFKTLRVWITNTVEDQPWQTNLGADSFDFSGSSNSAYRVKIEGRLLEDDDHVAETDKKDEAAKPAKSPVQGQRSRFSHFFKSMSVVVDRGNGGAAGGAPQEQIMEWKKPERVQNTAQLPPAADFDEISFKRPGDENTNIIISLVGHEDPERFAISPALAEVVDMQEGSRQEIIIRLWDYIKLMGLQEDDEKRNFRCDDLLRQVIGRDQGVIPGLQDYITPHIQPLAPVELAYTIRVDEAFHKQEGAPHATIYDVQVMVDDPLRARLFPFIHNPQYVAMLKEVSALDDQLAVLVQAVGQSRTKHGFFSSLHRDPANFVRSWLSSQQRDLDIIMGEAIRSGGEDVAGDEWRIGGKGGVWGSESARETVNLMLARGPR